jgi:hypothetical protein
MYGLVSCKPTYFGDSPNVTLGIEMRRQNSAVGVEISDAGIVQVVSKYETPE